MMKTVASGASSTAARKVSETVMNPKRTRTCIQVCCPGRASAAWLSMPVAAAVVSMFAISAPPVPGAAGSRSAAG